MNRKSLAYILITALAFSLWPKASAQSFTQVENPASAAECRQEKTADESSTEEKMAEINRRIKKARHTISRSTFFFLGSTSLLVFFLSKSQSRNHAVSDRYGYVLGACAIPLALISIVSLTSLFEAGAKLEKLKAEKRKLQPTIIFNPKIRCYAVGLAWRF